MRALAFYGIKKKEWPLLLRRGTVAAGGKYFQPNLPRIGALIGSITTSGCARSRSRYSRVFAGTSSAQRRVHTVRSPYPGAFSRWQ